ncbi:hypothetical protein MF672_035465 [Actinomadura sp. ATCC 31491]|uniref:Core-binding (CB) domain-containing protein n=1 Tax=Actinomadura luzonensis TaxID=2805427 RepID=A0ABT0G378_9ACTN|nr:hypothetical protein [Actinomadura luzonensis]MCK2219056.1 hypothetical protein [Actinomadura luzonensis]
MREGDPRTEPALPGGQEDPRPGTDDHGQERDDHGQERKEFRLPRRETVRGTTPAPARPHDASEHNRPSPAPDHRLPAPAPAMPAAPTAPRPAGPPAPAEPWPPTPEDDPTPLRPHPPTGTRPRSPSRASDAPGPQAHPGPRAPEPSGGDATPATPALPSGVTSVGDLPGLRPRRKPRDGGEAPAADVDLVDALDPQTWRVVAAWLHDKPSAATRQVALQVMASFLRWLPEAEPDVELLAVTGAHLEAFCEAARRGSIARTPGRPLTSKTVSRKRAALLSFYSFAWRCGVVRHNQVAGPRITRARRPGTARTLGADERRLLRKGVARLHADGRTTEAAAVALLELTGAAVEALAGLTRQDVRSVPDGPTSQPVVVTVNHGRDDVTAFLVSPLVRPLLRILCTSRPLGEPLLRRPDGRALDAGWLGSALTEAALAGGVPEERARLLTPAMLRATDVTDLLNDQGSFPPPSTRG